MTNDTDNNYIPLAEAVVAAKKRHTSVIDALNETHATWEALRQTSQVTAQQLREAHDALNTYLNEQAAGA